MEKKNKTSQPTKNPILIMHRVYLPPTGLRADCRVLYHNNTMSTPWGKVKPSDLQSQLLDIIWKLM